MHIEEITIDGFKSYAQRVTVPAFDPQFNAITGLNGSGKSNILDSICFVLGITNLQRVRANSLQELIYKQGQAGVTKASVSIVFNNTDKTKSPAGYEQYEKIVVTRQLAIGGRDKFMINGKLAQRQRVVDLFHSVSLNVNNPHFLIMQGMITKVLNMKPPEILGMLEEAAGTRMYETKRQGALKTLEKKQSKVDEINKMLTEEILPALEKLKKEKVDYVRWQDASTNLERLKRYVIAHEYTSKVEASTGGTQGVDAVKAELAALRDDLAAVDAELRATEDAIDGLKKEKELQSGGEVKELTAQSDALSKSLVQHTSEWNVKKKALQKERNNLKQLEAQLVELDADAVAAALQAATAARDEKAASLEAAQAAVTAAECALAGAQAGDGRDASNRSMQERLQDAKLAQTTAEAEAKAADVRAKHLTKELNEAKKRLGAKQGEAGKLAKELTNAQSNIDRCNERIKALGYDPDSAASLEATIAQHKAAIIPLKDQAAELQGQLAALNFQYKDPEQGFDRNKVKGVVAKLVRLKQPATATALEVAAAGKLYQVVVDSERTAKGLLSHGQLRQRVTIIPLNKVSSHGPSATAQQAATRMSDGKATLALELVGYDAEVAAAMKYAFGNAFVCKDATTAKKLAYSKEVATRCITLEGDDFNPTGLLTGGSRNRGPPLLARLATLQELEGSIAQHQEEVSKAQRALDAMSAAGKQYTKLQKELDLATHAHTLLQERIAGSESAQLQEAVTSLETNLVSAQEDAQAARTRRQELEAAAHTLEREMKDFAKDAAKHIKAAQGQLSAGKKGLEVAKREAKAAESKLMSVKAEAESASQEREAVGGQMQAQQQVIAALEEETETLTHQVAALKDEYDTVSAALADRTARLHACDGEIMSLTKEKGKLLQKKDNLDAEGRKREGRLKNLEKDVREAQEALKQIEKAYPWIPAERVNFGKPGTDYDWTTQDPATVYDAFKEATTVVDTLSNRVNKRVMQMYDKANQEYGELSRKKATVENDKQKIEAVICELDEKKKEALKLTWESVDGKFGSIFSTLLPGTTAKLAPVEGGTFLDGLEVKVAFGGVWKQSLTELSGGQRSLLALSLVLAMLLYKPAPIYILDEVDAALDLSHTQNIGRMIDKHFPQSQFIVVSLKEGMFNNANVIFRTKFVDGVSAVTRTVSDKRARGGTKGAAGTSRAPLRENVA